MISRRKLKVIDKDSCFYYKSFNGNFFNYSPKTKLIRNVGECREDFYWHFVKNTEYIGFHKTGLNIKQLSKFWNYIENRIGSKRKIVLHKSDKDIVVIKVSPFWRANTTRRSLFTALLRLGAVYYSGDFDKSVLKYYISKNTKYAINRFLNGFTKPTQKLTYNYYNGFGWHGKFAHASKKEIRKLLVKS